MSDTTTIRVSREVYNDVKALAQTQHENIQDVIEHAITEYKKKKFFDNLNAAYVRLHSDPAAWEEEQKEREIWDLTLSDGLENEDEG
jgi:predicted CopG family antitoxin